MALGIVGLLLALVPSSAAALAPPFPTPTRPEPVRALVVLDASGSMGRDGGHGQSLLAGAKRAMSELVFNLPTDGSTEVGLRVYGSEYGGDDDSLACADSSLLVPLGPNRPEQIVQAAEGLDPVGHTPIGYSLTQAARDFPRGGTARDVIILISDGEDTCGDVPPCDVVRDLKTKGLALHIETVGVDLARSSKARDQLRCISQVTGGSYYDAGSADALSAALKRISQQSLGIIGRGASIEPGVRRTQATLIKPGDYRVRIKPGQIAWYRFSAPEGAWPRIRATIQGVRENPMPKELRGCPSWRVELRNVGGEGYVYEPYGYTGIFDGVDFGTSGAYTNGPVSKTSTGIDYAGDWTVALLLGRGRDWRPLDCAEYLPDREYDVQFTLDYDGLDDLRPASASPSPASPSPTQAEKPVDSAAADKYRNPYDPDDEPGTFAVVGPMLFVAALVGLGAMIFRVIQKRRRGW